MVTEKDLLETIDLVQNPETVVFKLFKLHEMRQAK